MSERSKQILSMLMVIGAQSAEKALRPDELAQKIGTDLRSVEEELGRLVESGYAAASGTSGVRRYYLTGTGIIAASSTYS